MPQTHIVKRPKPPPRAGSIAEGADDPVRRPSLQSTWEWARDAILQRGPHGDGGGAQTPRPRPTPKNAAP